MKMNKMLTLVCGLALGSHLAAQQPRYPDFVTQKTSIL